MKEGFYPIHNEICGNISLRRKSFLGIQRKPIIIDIHVYSEAPDVIEFCFGVNTKTLEKTKVRDSISLLNTIRVNGDDWKYRYFPYLRAWFSLKLTFDSYRELVRSLEDIEVMTEFIELRIPIHKIKNVVDCHI